MDVKNTPREMLSTRDEKTFFNEFMEDFNTATFPSMKYYDLRSWERVHMYDKPVADPSLSDMEVLRYVHVYMTLCVHLYVRLDVCCVCVVHNLSLFIF